MSQSGAQVLREKREHEFQDAEAMPQSTAEAIEAALAEESPGVLKEPEMQTAGDATPPEPESEESKAAEDTEHAQAEPEIEAEVVPDEDEDKDGAEAEADKVNADAKEEETGAKSSDSDPDLANASPRTRERFERLAGEKRELSEKLAAAEQRAAQAEQNIEAVRQTFAQARASDDDLDGMVGYLTLRNSGDPAKLKEAIAILDAERQRLYVAAGQSVDFDPLDAFPDLRQKVADMEMDSADAAAIAQARVFQQAQREQAQRQQRQAQQAQQQQTDAQQQIVENAVIEMARYVEGLKNQPDHADRMKLLGDDLGERFAQTLPPQAWLAEFKREYEQAGRMLAQIEAERKTRAPTPLSATGAGGGRQRAKQPSNTMEAIDAAIAG